ncbi:hypothetical protein [Kaistella flava (ex Peng et al. 2021)]|uniref:hypothetical protein n=1 Tax=Kaistella flava (ex Peng et al. 2021) TaxID=2038776 RepID=UPI00187FA704|nr:hypothetical protein [Kaistella flava (ex Peng et al. 2021)]
MATIVRWTMTAETRQYQESLVINEAIKNNINLEREWENFQEKPEIEMLEREVEAIE